MIKGFRCLEVASNVLVDANIPVRLSFVHLGQVDRQTARSVQSSRTLGAPIVFRLLVLQENCSSWKGFE